MLRYIAVFHARAQHICTLHCNAILHSAHFSNTITDTPHSPMTYKTTMQQLRVYPTACWYYTTLQHVVEVGHHFWLILFCHPLHFLLYAPFKASIEGFTILDIHRPPLVKYGSHLKGGRAKWSKLKYSL